VFTFNNRTVSDLDRFALALEAVGDRRLTYAQLTRHS